MGDNTYKTNIDSPALHDLLQKDGMLVFPRRFLKNSEYRIRYDDDSSSLVSDLILPKEDNNLYKVICTGELTVACAFLVRDSKCSKCQTSYHLCNCSKFVDEDVIQNMTDVPILGPFWTNRKA